MHIEFYIEYLRKRTLNYLKYIIFLSLYDLLTSDSSFLFSLFLLVRVTRSDNKNSIRNLTIIDIFL
jgi:hypothetical protein